jgi:hypothetical protein
MQTNKSLSTIPIVVSICHALAVLIFAIWLHVSDTPEKSQIAFYWLIFGFVDFPLYLVAPTASGWITSFVSSITGLQVASAWFLLITLFHMLVGSVWWFLVVAFLLRLWRFFKSN